MESQPTSLQEHHMTFELLPFHEDNIWDNTLINEPVLLNSPNYLWATSVNDPWQSMSAHEIQQLAWPRMSSPIQHYMSSNLHNICIESGSTTTSSSSLISSLNPQSLQEDTTYIIEADATRCAYTYMSNASRNDPSSFMHNMPHSLTKPYNHSSLLAAPPVWKVDADHYSSLVMRLHDDGQASLSDTALGIVSAAASMPSSAPMFHMASTNEESSSNFVQSEPCSSNLVQAPCYRNSVSHPSATLAKSPSSSINYHVNIENDQIFKCPIYSSSLSLLAASTIPSSISDTKHYINNSAPSSVSLSHPNTTTPAQLCHFVNDQVINNDQVVQKSTEFCSSMSLHPVHNHIINPKQHSVSPNQHSTSLNEHSFNHNQHSSLSEKLNKAHKSTPCSKPAPEMTISSMSSSLMSDGDHHHELNEDPLEGATEATMDDRIEVDQESHKKSMNTYEETKNHVHAEVHPSHIGDADNCSAAHTPSLDLLKTKKNSHKKGKKNKLQKHSLRPTRIALVTQSENERLEDGFRWRKYGQKSVKNSPYPRSYYRCTTRMCSVKKRVERSPLDASMVITTYEGNHNHHTLSALRGIEQTHLATKPCVNNGNSTLNITKKDLQYSLGIDPSITKSFEYDHYANRYSLIMQLQAQHYSSGLSIHPSLPNLSKTF